MADGTFTLTGTVSNVGTDVAIPVNAATLNEALAIAGDGKYVLFGSAGFPRSYILRVSTITNSWVLVGLGGGTYSFASLPAGFKIVDAQLNYGGGADTNFFGGSDAFCNANSSAAVQYDVLTEQVLIRAGGVVSPATPFLRTLPVTPLSLNNDGYGFRFSCTNLVDFHLDVLTITGSYNLFAFTYTLDPPSGSSVDAGNDDQGGNLITITSNPLDPDHLKLNHLTISVACGPITIVEQTETSFKFYLPIACNGAGSTNIVATGDGTQFSGSVTLGTLVILLTNASGIYTLVPGKTNDTLYSSLRNGSTRSVKIPNPFAKTGFIGG